MDLTLLPHPSQPAGAVRAITVALERPDSGVLALRYTTSGTLDAVAWPAPGAATFTDGLWRHSCFEAFVGGAGEDYGEINLAPSGAWAAYRFDRYRAGMARDDSAAVRGFAWHRSAGCAELRAEIALPDLAGIDAWRIALSAVIEEIDGIKSYWALAHAAGAPDFHNRDCFTATLAAPAVR